YQAMNASINAAAKRYRYTGMERDEESGLEYHSARYYLPWLGRWLSADPIGVSGGLNVYAYSHNAPLAYTDGNGQDPEAPTLHYTPTLRKAQEGKTGYDEDRGILYLTSDKYFTPILSRLKLHGDPGEQEPTEFETNLVNDFNDDKIS